MRILLVEPDSVLAQSYMTGLQAAGHMVDHAQSAQAAVHCADEHTPDCAIVSLEMARHNGIEFLYEFRSYGEWQDVPAILLTSLPTPELLRDGVLRTQLKVHTVLVRSQTSVADLARAVQRLGQRQEA